MTKEAIQETIKKRLTDTKLVSYFISFLMLTFLGLLIALITLISGEWCFEKATSEQCSKITLSQLTGLKIIAYALVATLGFSVLTFAVAVWAGAKLSFAATTEGVEGNIS